MPPTYLCVSIFYAQSQWHELISNCLAPFIAQHKNLFEEYVIKFSQEQGQNLRIIIKSKETKKFRERLDKTLNLYIKSNPSTVLPQEFTDDLLFINFPNNHHYFDLFETGNKQHNNISEVFKNKLQVLISKNIASRLAKSPIDQESILTFGMYIQCALIRSVYAKNQNILLDLRDISNNLLKQLPVNHHVKIDLQCMIIKTENAEELNSLTGILWDTGPVTNEFKWLKDLSKKLHNILPETENAKVLVANISGILFKQIDLSDTRLLALSALLNYELMLKMHRSK